MANEPRPHDAATATDAYVEALGEPPVLVPPPPPPPPAHAASRRGVVVVAAVVGVVALFALGGLVTWLALRRADVEVADVDRRPVRKDDATKKPPPVPCAEGDLEQCTARCAQGSGPSCARLGEMYEKGHGVTRDDEKAADAYSKGCARADARACSRLGGLYQTGKGRPVDYAESVRLIRKACDHGYVFSCAWLAWKGEGETRDLAKAERLFGKACLEEDLRACTWQGEMRQMGLGIGAPDPEGARALFRRGCDGGEAYSCWRLGQTLMLRSDPAEASEAVDLERRACAADVRGACDDLRALGLGASGTAP
jgi:hypothetical protein